MGLGTRLPKALTAHSDSLSKEIKRGVLSQPEMQWINMPPSPKEKSTISCTESWEIFVIGIFSYSMLCTKIKRTKLKRMRIINVNMHGKGLFVRKLFNTKTYCAKYF